MFVKIDGETQYLWRALDHEGEILENYVTKMRSKGGFEVPSQSASALRSGKEDRDRKA